MVAKRGYTELYRSAEYVVDFLPKVKVEAVAPGDRVEAAIEAITKAARTGRLVMAKFSLPQSNKLFAFVLAKQTSLQFKTIK